MRGGGSVLGKRGDDDDDDEEEDDDEESEDMDEDEDENSYEDYESEEDEEKGEDESEEGEGENAESKVDEGEDNESVNWAIKDAMDEADCESICSVIEPLYPVCSRNREGELAKWQDGCELLKHNCLNPMDLFFACQTPCVPA
ncbi:MAG: hypothetical protein J3R72DRAFT_416291 [Linnemannia gamsii]|nr:MAG: hypothetical protein J3R72DRAFT_416291 [Linnemannia gamsii]